MVTPVGSMGLWVRFRVDTVPPLRDIGTFSDDVQEFLRDDVLVPLQRGIEGVPSEEEMTIPVPDATPPRGDLIDRPGQGDENRLSAIVGSALAEALTTIVPGTVKFETVSVETFAGLKTILAEFDISVDLTQVPAERRLAAAEIIQNTVLTQGVDLYFAVVDRLRNGPGPSPPGQPPAMDTGDLVDSIRLPVPPDRLGVAVGSDLERAKFLEFGTRKMPARPFLFPVFEREQPGIEGAIRDAARSGPPRFLGTP